MLCIVTKAVLVKNLLIPSVGLWGLLSLGFGGSMYCNVQAGIVQAIMVNLTSFFQVLVVLGRL